MSSLQFYISDHFVQISFLIHWDVTFHNEIVYSYTMFLYLFKTLCINKLASVIYTEVHF